MQSLLPGKSFNICFIVKYHRVGRVLAFSPVVGIGTPPTPSQQASAPSPLGSGGRGTLAGERGGGRVPIPARGHTLWYSICICVYVLCVKYCTLYKRRKLLLLPVVGENLNVSYLQLCRVVLTIIFTSTDVSLLTISGW